jgi:hypothetical protein
LNGDGDGDGDGAKYMHARMAWGGEIDDT